MTNAEERALRAKMKPCPFCGIGRARLQPYGLGGETNDGRDGVHSGCDRCGSYGPIALTAAAAVRLWNMRRAPR